MNKKCVICNSDDIVDVFLAENQTLSRYGLTRNRTNDLGECGLTLDMKQCMTCGLVFNFGFDYKLVNYESEEIQEARGFSPRYKQFMLDSSDQLKSLINLNGKTIMEIGCGDGYFLSLFQDKSLCIGFEPSPERNAAINRGINVVGRYFDWNNTKDVFCDLVIMRQVLEHLPDPVKMLEAIREVLSRATNDAYVYIEVPNANKTIEFLRFADFYYEHCLYFTTGSLVALLEKHGFTVVSCEEKFNGEVLTIIGRVRKEKLSSNAFVIAKANAMNNVKKMRDSGLTIVGWGSAGNGSSFLNICNFDETVVEYVIDSDKRKQGKYLPGTGQLVTSPETLNDRPADVVIVFTQFHKNDISNEIRDKYPFVSKVYGIEDLSKSDII